MDIKVENGFMHNNERSIGQFEGFVFNALNSKSIAMNDDNVNINPIKRRKLR